MTQAMSTHLGEALGTDFFSVREQFTGEQWSHFITVRKFVDEEVVPVIGEYWEQAEIPWPLVRRLPELGIVGEDIQGYGCAGMSPMACGLVTMELHRGDGSLGVVLGVHAALRRASAQSPRAVRPAVRSARPTRVARASQPVRHQRHARPDVGQLSDMLAVTRLHSEYPPDRVHICTGKEYISKKCPRGDLNPHGGAASPIR